MQLSQTSFQGILSKPTEGSDSGSTLSLESVGNSQMTCSAGILESLSFLLCPKMKLSPDWRGSRIHQRTSRSQSHLKIYRQHPYEVVLAQSTNQDHLADKHLKHTWNLEQHLLVLAKCPCCEILALNTSQDHLVASGLSHPDNLVQDLLVRASQGCLIQKRLGQPTGNLLWSQTLEPSSNARRSCPSQVFFSETFSWEGHLEADDKAFAGPSPTVKPCDTNGPAEMRC